MNTTVFDNGGNVIAGVNVTATISKVLKNKIIVTPATSSTNSIGEATFLLSKKGKKKGKGIIIFKAGSKSAKVNVKIN